MKKSRNLGFSLVELIIVIAIMAILTGVSVPIYLNFVEKGREATDIQIMDGAMELGHAAYVAGDFTFGDTIYYYDQSISADKPTGYGKGTFANARNEYLNACCDDGVYDGSIDYRNRIIEVTFTGTSEEDCVVHVHWVEE